LHSLRFDFEIRSGKEHREWKPLGILRRMHAARGGGRNARGGKAGRHKEDESDVDM
jgi:hypothetical protein